MLFRKDHRHPFAQAPAINLSRISKRAYCYFNQIFKCDCVLHGSGSQRAEAVPPSQRNAKTVARLTVPIKKSELYSSLWESCDELRGGMDASQYKDYVLVLLFVKYVSDKYAGQKDALLDVPAGGRFADMVALKGDKEIGDKINKIIGKLAEANNLKGVIDVADFNNEDKLGKGKEMVDRLSNLVSIFNNPALDFRDNRVEGDDILGDAYEYLMRHFATESGKSKGQFYTPAEVSLVIAKVVGIAKAKSQAQTVYDLPADRARYCSRLPTKHRMV